MNILRALTSAGLTLVSALALNACASDVEVPETSADAGRQQPPADAPPATDTAPVQDAGMQPTPDAGPQPQPDASTPPPPPCNGANLQTDSSNCGTCGTRCASGQSCQAGTCVSPPPTCGAGQTSCSGSCCTLATDANNCGACGNRCASGESCFGGMCIAPQFDSYEVTATAPMPVDSIDINEYWGGAHCVANYLDPERAGRPFTTYTCTFRVARNAYVAINATYTFPASSGLRAAYACSVHTVGGPFVPYGTLTVRRNGVMSVMTRTSTNGRMGCNYTATDRTPPPGY